MGNGLLKGRVELGGGLGIAEDPRDEAEAKALLTENPDWLDQALTNHAAKIGYIAMSWSRMQEHLGQLFVYLVSPTSSRRGWAVWHTIVSDLTQRQMLAAVVREVYQDKKDPMRVEIEWILRRVQAILDNRNGAIHVAFQIGVWGDGARMVPIDHTGNPRAHKMTGRDLAADFEFTTKQIERLGHHAKNLAPFLRPPPFQPATGPLPQRPPAPVAPQTTAKGPQGEPE